VGAPNFRERRQDCRKYSVIGVNISDNLYLEEKMLDLSVCFSSSYGSATDPRAFHTVSHLYQCEVRLWVPQDYGSSSQAVIQGRC
jgi:hypothetical protein